MLGLIITLVLPLAASAATITVNTTADNTTAGDGQCTLREAIANVNAAGDTTGGDCTAGTGAGDTIDFNLGLPASIKLTLGELAIEQSVEITGPTTGSLRIDGHHASRVFEIQAGTTKMSDVTIQHGRQRSIGAGILVDAGASLSLTTCTVSGNKGRVGGGIANLGTATLTNCTLRQNGSGSGSGLYNAAGSTATLANCALSRNDAHASGGGLFNDGGTVTMTHCTFRGNKGLRGGGIANVGTTSTVILTNCTLTRNQVLGDGAGLGNFGGTATLTNCTFNRNQATGFGGAIANDGGMSTVSNCTLRFNGSSRGGGIWNGTGSTVALTNCTLSSNLARRPSALQDAFGGGLANDGGTATLTNTIVSDSRRAGDCGGAITSQGHNLGSDDTCFSGGSDLANADPMLAPLANHGDPTDTMALCSGVGVPHPSCTGGSPAIDAGDDAVLGPPDNLTADQRGLPRKAGVHVDIGAYEVQ